jgi:hypothetical protein
MAPMAGWLGLFGRTELYRVEATGRPQAAQRLGRAGHSSIYSSIETTSEKQSQ